MTTQRPRHIVFDWDGTLLDTVAVEVAADAAIAARFGWAVVDADHYRAHMSRHWRDYYDHLRALAGGQPLTDAELDDVYDAWHAEVAARRHEQALHDEALPTLQALAAAGVTASVCSMHRHEPLRLLIDSFGLTPYLTRIDGLAQRDTGRTTKAQHLREHVRSLDIPTESIGVVGDDVDDASAAAEIGAQAVLVSTGVYSPERLAASGHRTAGGLLEAMRTLGVSA